MSLINKLIIDTLKQMEIPVSLHRYRWKAKEYITFHEYLSSGEEYEDDDERLTSHFIQIDIWSKGDYIELVNKVKELLVGAGFKRIDEVDLYEEDTEIYHKGIRFYYLEDREVI